ncbi:hypothetical protein ADIMK_2291 [Marinobacterium lacunae]|uniref:Uncharacterized protein n=1 Tax=Marinobacterium lacunae TaxID=1232683 RepID=A0A081FYA7_9GAMM|nr:hypothetical protein [Marinobacterium lacunae]KEA63512.1 hypothetical protein ADIMK_2291 [Marinobacterium lacunae]MBR9885003.1 hypothetical protein [Oceanospirillales bacterium]
MLGAVAAIWGFVGICMLFGSAIYRLGPMAMDLPVQGFSWYHWAALIFSIIFMGFAEGYRGFQQNFSPRVAARIRYLSNNVTPMRVILAPVFCMGFFHAKRRRQIVSFCLTAGIVVLVLLVRQLDQPWRGIIDVGVVLGLSWGILSLAVFTYQAFTRNDFDYSPETP